MFCSSPRVFLDGVGCLTGDYFRKHLDGYPLQNLSDLVSGNDPVIEKLFREFQRGLQTEFFVLFNYNHFGPVALLFSPQTFQPSLLTGYGCWEFSHYHFRYFLGHGKVTYHPRYDTPMMFYPYFRGLKEVGDVVSICMFEFAKNYDVKKSLSRKILKLVANFERGYSYSLTGKKPFDGSDLFAGVLRLVRDRYPRHSYEHLAQIFSNHGVYYHPAAVCDEFRRVFEIIWQFLFTLDLGTPSSIPLEKYLLSVGFTKSFVRL